MATLSFGGVIYGYVLTADRAQWSAYSLAAQSLAMQGVEQARAAKWDPKAWPAVDELGLTNYTQVDTLDVPVSGQPVLATNYISVTLVSQDPPLRQLRADCVWSLANGREAGGPLPTPSSPSAPPINEPAAPHPSASRARPATRSAFTLAEIMTAMGLFSLVVIGVVYSQLFGMRMFNITSTRLSASDSARKVLNRVRDDIRSGKILYVGNGDSADFTNITLNGLRQGNALQIYPTTDTNVFIRYYLDPASQSLKRTASGSGQVQVLAPYLTNQIAFFAEDFAGNTLTNDQNNRVIKMVLDFYQWEFPVAQVGGGRFLRLLPSANPNHPPGHRVTPPSTNRPMKTRPTGNHQVATRLRPAAGDGDGRRQHPHLCQRRQLDLHQHRDERPQQHLQPRRGRRRSGHGSGARLHGPRFL